MFNLTCILHFLEQRLTQRHFDLSVFKTGVSVEAQHKLLSMETASLKSNAHILKLFETMTSGFFVQR